MAHLGVLQAIVEKWPSTNLLQEAEVFRHLV